MPVLPFITITATTAFPWILFSVSLSALCVFGLLLVWRVWRQQIRDRLRAARFLKWEFWPAWLFYPPVALYCVWQGIKHRSFSLPAIANLSQKNGGIVGESKIGILSELMATSPETTAEAFLIEADSAATRLARIRELCLQHEIGVPFVLKPDIAQRGAGFKKIQSLEEVHEYLSRVSAPLLLQRYVAAPYEAGIFYYRFPGEPKGHILGITRKVFPCVTGDGIRTIRELIEADSRAQLIAHTYLKRFGAKAERVIAQGEQFRLVEAGNHCQGCEFRDGSELLTRELQDRFDSISQNLQGFFVGRFDVRYWSDDELRQGRNFQIIELNGAASEATHIYDSRNSLWSAYKMLSGQWRIVYAIGAANRRLGFRPPSSYAVWRDWREFATRACEFPLAD